MQWLLPRFQDNPHCCLCGQVRQSAVGSWDPHRDLAVRRRLSIVGGPTTGTHCRDVSLSSPTGRQRIRDGGSDKRRLGGVCELNDRQPARQQALGASRSPRRLCCQDATAAVRLSLAAVLIMRNGAGLRIHHITYSSPSLCVARCDDSFFSLNRGEAVGRYILRN
jgi:hypothetical protein